MGVCFCNIKGLVQTIFYWYLEFLRVAFPCFGFPCPATFYGLLPAVFHCDMVKGVYCFGLLSCNHGFSFWFVWVWGGCLGAVSGVFIVLKIRGLNLVPLLVSLQVNSTFQRVALVWLGCYFM